jgi:hypothetical protein
MFLLLPGIVFLLISAAGGGDLGASCDAEPERTGVEVSE